MPLEALHNSLDWDHITQGDLLLDWSQTFLFLKSTAWLLHQTNEARNGVHLGPSPPV